MGNALRYRLVWYGPTRSATCMTPLNKSDADPTKDLVCCTFNNVSSDMDVRHPTAVDDGSITDRDHVDNQANENCGNASEAADDVKSDATTRDDESDSCDSDATVEIKTFLRAHFDVGDVD